MFQLFLIFTVIFFLFGTFFLTAISSAFRRIHKRDGKKQLQNLGWSFFYRPFHQFFLPEYEFEGLFFAITCAQSITRFCSSFCMLVFLILTFGVFSAFSQFETPQAIYWGWFFTSLFSYVIIAFLFADCIPRIIGSRYPQLTLRMFAPFASIYLFLVFPLTYIFLKVSQVLSKRFYFDLSYEPIAEAQQEIIDMIQKADLTNTLDIHDKTLIEAVMRFKERIAREVMVPRVNVFSLSAEISIKEAARLLEQEGYSRIPVYKNTIDNIVGVLMYKDILNKYREYEAAENDMRILDAPIETIQKNVLHVPETKKISSLLQEFRKKQVHMAIIVDEYGGTEGIVTIEDILEEIVGEIADEYDQEADLYYLQSDNTWVVDARMNILDAEEAFDITVPEEGDFDTIGGYVFHTAGIIPSKGFVIHQDDFEMEILQSNDRCVEKVRIKTYKTKSD